MTSVALALLVLLQGSPPKDPLAALDVPAFVARALSDAKLEPAERARVASALEARIRRRIARAKASCKEVERTNARLTLECTVENAQHHLTLVLGPGGRAVDVDVEGALLSRNYRARMNRALRTRTPSEVIASLETAPETSFLTP